MSRLKHELDELRNLGLAGQRRGSIEGTLDEQRRRAAQAVADSAARTGRALFRRSSADGAIAAAIAQWESRWTEDGREYFVNARTGVSQWERPAEPAAEAPVAMVVAEGGTSVQSRIAEWERRWTEDGTEYFVNLRTSVSQWERPDGWSEDVERVAVEEPHDDDDAAAAATTTAEEIVATVEAHDLTHLSQWVQEVTDDGTPYYVSTLSGVSQWERPVGWEDGTKAEGELTEEESVEDELLMADEDESEEEEWEATMTSPRARAATAEHAVATSPRTLSPAVAAAAAAAAANQAAAANAALLAEQQREAQQREVQEQRALQLAEQEILRAQQEQEVLLRKQLQRRQAEAEAEVEAEAEEARKAAQIAAAEASSSEGEYEEELDEEGYVSEEYEGREGESGDEECRLGNSPWFEFYANEETEEVYYFNEATGESSWDRPHIEGLDDLDDLDGGDGGDGSAAGSAAGAGTTAAAAAAAMTNTLGEVILEAAEAAMVGDASPGRALLTRSLSVADEVPAAAVAADVRVESACDSPGRAAFHALMAHDGGGKKEKEEEEEEEDLPEGPPSVAWRFAPAASSDAKVAAAAVKREVQLDGLRLEGRVVAWQRKRAFGFIKPLRRVNDDECDGAEWSTVLPNSVFAHIRHVHRRRHLKSGDRVHFTLRRSEAARDSAGPSGRGGRGAQQRAFAVLNSNALTGKRKWEAQDVTVLVKHHRGGGRDAHRSRFARR